MIPEGQRPTKESFTALAVDGFERDVPQFNALGYALFPFQKNERRLMEASGVRGLTFELTLTFSPALKADVEAAVWGWLNFGGLGARSRRGCGSLWTAKQGVHGSTAKLKKWFKNSFKAHCGSFENECRNWPTLSNAVLLGGKPVDPITAWKQAVSLLREFRQGLDVGRLRKIPGNDFPGPSLWPESENIRRTTGQSFSRHERQPDMPSDYMPRAEFGLPIIFHFRHSESSDRHVKPGDSLDPADTVLNPGTGENVGNRMASPLIVKVLGIEGRKFVPVFARLCVPAMDMVSLDWVQPDGKPAITGSEFFVCGPPLNKSKVLPMRNRSEKGSAIDAFWSFAKGRGFHEFSAAEAAE